MTQPLDPHRRPHGKARLPRTAALALTILVLGMPAVAQDFPVPGRQVRYGTTRLVYFNGGSVAENATAAFSCRSRTQVQIQLYVGKLEMVDWLRAAGGAPLWAELVLDGVARRLKVSSFHLSELTGDWVVPLDWSEAARGGGALGRDTMAAFGVATDIAIRTPAFTVVLSPAEGDADARPRFVRDCMSY